MGLLVRSLRTNLLCLCMLMSLVIPLIGSVSCAPESVRLVVGGKLDIESQLLTEMYVLLLRRAGFDVTNKGSLGTNEVVFQAITSGQIDLYPEFTGDGLARLGLTTTHDMRQDYQLIKQGYETKYHITWLNVAPGLNDTYGICTLPSTASQLHVTAISQLAPFVSSLTIATPLDGATDPNVLPGLRGTYGITFSKVIVVAEESTFQAVIQGQAQLNICYTTSPLISRNNFVLLNDDKHLFPIYSPAPIIRNEALAQAPQIATILNPLSSRLTNAVSTMLQAEVAAGFSVSDVAATWLKSQGLL